MVGLSLALIAAFPLAFTTHLADGLPAQTGRDTMQFKASRAGQYLIACGVPGHAVTGMYIKFVVSPSASAPSNTGTIGPPLETSGMLSLS